MKDLLGANGSNSHLPRITIVTPALGNDDQLEATIRSVVHQDYPHLEYIIIEDGTSEKRREIIRQYASRLTWRCCPANTELCRAVNMAFAESSGEIMGWLEPGEMLHINGVQVIGSVFSAFPEVDWITGRPFLLSPSGLPTGIKHLERWTRMRFLAGGNKYIHRDTTFWRRRLWDRAGGALSTDYGLAGEFEMFVRFFRFARLYSVDALIGGFRTHPGYCNPANSHRIYNQTCDQIADRELASIRGAYVAKLFRGTTRFIYHIPRVRRWWHKCAIFCVYRCPGPDWPPRIVAKGDEWMFDSRRSR
jgi:glycosyltransferase involved in cell wall biosynthesis